MKLEISKKLANWIAQSESYQTYIDFNIEESSIARYTIIGKYQDFFISLYSLSIDFIKGKFELDEAKKSIALSRGLELFTSKTKDIFSGINKDEIFLLTSSLRLLSGFSSTSLLIVKNIELDHFKDKDTYEFILSILKRNTIARNPFSKRISEFLYNGDFSIIKELLDAIEEKISEGLNNDIDAYAANTIAKAVLEYFEKNCLWSTLIRIDADINFWERYVSKNIENNIWYFFPSQVEAIGKGIVNSEKSFSMQMPTSAGKTSLCELIIYYHNKKKQSSKIILLAPFRALASELKNSLAKRLIPYGITVKTLYGGSVPTSSEKVSIDESNLLIITPEKMMAIEDVFPDILNDVDLVICDEGHLLDDANRGFDYELFLTRLKIIKGDAIRFIYLSAIVPNIKDVNIWLGGENDSIAYSDFRPTILEYAVVEAYGEKNAAFSLNVNPKSPQPKNYVLYSFLRKEDFQYINPETGRKNTYNFWSSKKSLSAACALKSLSSGAVALFAPTKRDSGVSGLCDELISQIDLKNNYSLNLPDPRDYSDQEYLSLLIEYFSQLFSEEYLLVQCLERGFVFHHGSLPQYAREIVESCVRDEKIKLVVCTTTLAEGVNLPLKTLVVHTTKRQTNQRWHNLTNREIKNLIGRVGRAGKEKSGFIIVPHQEDLQLIHEASENIGIHPVKGYLYRIIEAITEAIRTRGIDLSNQILENQNESFLKLIDSIDSAILDLIGRDVNLSTLDEIASVLVESTFSYTQSSEEQKKLFKELIRLRSDKIKNNISEESLIKVRTSGSNLRFYLNVMENVDLSNEIWLSKVQPLDLTWIDFLFNQLEHFEFINFEVQEEGQYNYIGSIATLKDFVISWIQGMSYGKLSEIYEISIDNCLDVVNDHISYQLANLFSNLIRIREQELAFGESLDESIIYWPLLLQHGFEKTLMLTLHSLGFTDRIGIIALANYIENNYILTSISESSIAELISENLSSILENLAPEIPRLSSLEIEKAANNI
ncbi:DEAD/DEAH box helicase [Leptospira sp. SA-E8]|uniref:DEAD/DEAH box helicase n=1 Tax=Leptospira sp. SA-E8 TaxID=3422259 RepID=UPI003EB8EEBE